MAEFIKKLYRNQGIRYIFFGGCTTMVNLVSFFILRKLKVELNTAMLLITHDLGVVMDVCDKVNVMYAGSIVERGTVDQVFDDPTHPYTRGLFKSIPDLDVDTDRLEPIPGMMPDPSNLPVGCAFAPRCPCCKDICKSQRPQTTELEEGHFVSCFLFGQQSEMG